jgi:hypothetical protein
VTRGRQLARARRLAGADVLDRRLGRPVRHARGRRDQEAHGRLTWSVKMSSGRNADTSMLGTSTSWLIFKSTATLQIA